MILRFSLFLLINGLALSLGGLFTTAGVKSNWYMELLKAPWTPAGWVFGFAWTIIMICFAIYMTYAYKAIKGKVFLSVLFAIQLVLNISWNPLFFYFQNILAGLLTISALTFLIGWFLYKYREEMGAKGLLLLPYFVWLLIATSLNAYIWVYN
jgi:translocator protein